ncbi:hypothetical protein ANCCAN_02342 [Ancylostoma caninum]|uniref:Uncharacterized protein n=1 Tax=Ancylostoma caninum TaxID=29170 RepID=A0A368H4Z1_ANCCA|nr:hypothetical protein ANCCAN_02342 [Ancylostoma caninum]
MHIVSYCTGFHIRMSHPELLIESMVISFQALPTYARMSSTRVAVLRFCRGNIYLFAYLKPFGTYGEICVVFS